MESTALQRSPAADLGRRRWWLQPSGAAFVAGPFLAGAGFAVWLGPSAGGPAFGLTLLAMLGWWVGAHFHRRRIVAAMSAGDAALEAGSFDEADAYYARACSSARGLPGIHATAVYQLGVVATRDGRWAEAASLFAALDAAPAGRIDEALQGEATLALAYCRALAGELEAARDAIGRLEKAEASPLALLETRTIVALRSGQAQQALRWLEQGWEEAEETFSGQSMKTFRILRALATADGGAGYREQAASAEVRGLLNSLHPFRRGTWDHLASSWPQLGRFLDDHRLAAGPADVA